MLKALGGFRGEKGVKGKGLLQGAETDLCERMRGKFGRSAVYNPDAIVYHKGRTVKNAISIETSVLAVLLEEGDERVWVFDRRGGEIVSECLRERSGVIGRVEDFYI